MGDGFVYCLTQHSTGMLYVGVHKGTTDDGYICSSKLVMEQYNENDWSREIIATGQYHDMINLETAILKAEDAAKNPVYYNQHNGDGNFYCKGVTAETRAKISNAHTGRKHTNQSRRNMSLAHMGQVRTKEMSRSCTITILESQIGKRGVHWDKSRNRWKASIQIDGKTVFLGRFQTKEEAQSAYDSAARKRIEELKNVNN